MVVCKTKYIDYISSNLTQRKNEDARCFIWECMMIGSITLVLLTTPFKPTHPFNCTLILSTRCYLHYIFNVTN